MQEMIENVEKVVTGSDSSHMSPSDAIRSSAKNIAAFAIESMNNKLLDLALEMVGAITKFANELE